MALKGELEAARREHMHFMWKERGWTGEVELGGGLKARKGGRWNN
jgi:hypothetical protein